MNNPSPRRAYPAAEPEPVGKRLLVVAAIACALALVLGVIIWSVNSPTAWAENTEETPAPAHSTATSPGASTPSEAPRIVFVDLRLGERCGDAIFEYRMEPENALVEVYRKAGEGIWIRQARDPVKRLDAFLHGGTVQYKVLIPGGAEVVTAPLEVPGCLTPTPAPSTTPTRGAPTTSATPAPATGHAPGAVATPGVTVRPNTTPSPTLEYDYQGGLANTGE